MAEPTEAELLALLELQNAQLDHDVRAVSFDKTIPSRKASLPPSPVVERKQLRRFRSSSAIDRNKPSPSASTASLSFSSHDETAETETDLKASKAEIDTWADIINNFDTWFKKRQKKLTELVYGGVPATLRCVVWQKFSQHRRNAALSERVNTASGGLDDLELLKDDPRYEELITQKCEHEKTIQLDIARTFPDHHMFQNDGLGQEVLFNVIKAFAVYDQEVGYCQGLPFIVGLLLMYMPEEEAFQMLVVLTRDYRLRGLFKPSMADLPLRLYQLEGLIRSAYPDLASHLTEIGIEASMFASQWFLTLFASSLPLESAFRIVDIFLLEGIPALFRVGLAIVGNHHDALLSSNLEGALKLLTRNELYERYSNRVNDLVAAIKRVSISPKLLQRLASEYEVSRVEKSEQEKELDKYKSRCQYLEKENKDLKIQLESLEEAYALLASKLVTRTETVEDLQTQVWSMQGSAASTTRASISTSPLRSQPPQDMYMNESEGQEKGEAGAEEAEGKAEAEAEAGAGAEEAGGKGEGEQEQVFEDSGLQSALAKSTSGDSNSSISGSQEQLSEAVKEDRAAASSARIGENDIATEDTSS